jgi:hydroxymethylpyrimidine pyrophosphatase-like HAD family hydrolase
MLQSAALAVAMGNAHPLVLETAHRVIATNADDGLAILLEELIEGFTPA